MTRRALILAVVWAAPISAEQVKEIDHVRVAYDGISAEQAEAIANTLAAARAVYLEAFGFDMPKTIDADVRCGPDERTRLFTDGEDHVTLSLKSADQLGPPSQSGVFNLYGMCHEVGHVAMYRTLKDRDWMTTAAAEGWAHYAGSVVVDAVYKAEGPSLWCEPYDYRADGTARLKRQLEGKGPSNVARGAGQWLALEEIIGRKAFPKLFAGWQAAGVDPAEPSEALLAAAIKAFPPQEKSLQTWWTKAGPLFVERRSRSRHKAKRIPRSRLTGTPVVLSYDDDASEGKKSIAGGGHATSFKAPGAGEWYIRSVSVYGARYGHPRAPRENFDVALCDAQGKVIDVWKKPYGTFRRGNLRWVRMDVPPSQVPTDFTICLNFRPTRTKGVFVAYDADSKGHSRVATPGQAGSEFSDGDWMIRVEVDQPKATDPLREEGGKATEG